MKALRISGYAAVGEGQVHRWSVHERVVSRVRHDLQRCVGAAPGLTPTNFALADTLKRCSSHALNRVFA
jgi:hypothetical protein